MGQFGQDQRHWSSRILPLCTTWQATQPNMTTTGMFNIVYLIGSHMGFFPKHLVASTIHMSANVSNLFVSTLGGKTKANNYANRFFPP